MMALRKGQWLGIEIAVLATCRPPERPDSYSQGSAAASKSLVAEGEAAYGRQAFAAAIGGIRSVF